MKKTKERVCGAVKLVRVGLDNGHEFQSLTGLRCTKNRVVLHNEGSGSWYYETSPMAVPYEVIKKEGNKRVENPNTHPHTLTTNCEGNGLISPRPLRPRDVSPPPL